LAFENPGEIEARLYTNCKIRSPLCFVRLSQAGQPQTQCIKWCSRKSDPRLRSPGSYGKGDPDNKAGRVVRKGDFRPGQPGDEGAQQLEDEPELRYGASISFRAGHYASLTLDYLRSRYKHNFAMDNSDNFLSHGDQFAAQLSIAF
jgi:hypothetical protein